MVTLLDILFFLREWATRWIDGISDAAGVLADEVKNAFNALVASVYAEFPFPFDLFVHLGQFILAVANAVLAFVNAVFTSALDAALEVATLIATAAMPPGYRSKVMTGDDALRLMLSGVSEAGQAVVNSPFGPLESVALGYKLTKLRGLLEKLLNLAFRAVIIGQLLGLLIGVAKTFVRVFAVFTTLSMLGYLVGDILANDAKWKARFLRQTVPRKKVYAWRTRQHVGRPTIIRRRMPGGSKP